MSKIYMKQDEYRAWRDEKVKRFGTNPLDWPPYIRQMVAKIMIVDEVKLEFRQAGLPFSNTGVRNDYE